MPYTMEDLEREVAEEVLKKMTPEQVLSHLPLAEIENYLRKQKAAQQKSSPDPQKPQSP
jgi:hypothetical protein